MRTSDWAELFRDGRGAFTIILNLGIGLHAIDVFVISTIMPTVVGDIGGAHLYAWPTILYTALSIAGAASANPLMVAVGPRKGYAIGGLLFLLGSAGCAASPLMPFLLVARAVQGFGGGLMVAQSMALVSDLYPAGLRTRILALVSGVWAVAALLGPMIGGIFAEIHWWRGAFWINLPIILGFTALAWRALPPTTAAKDVQRFPIRRIALLLAGVLCAGVTENIDQPIVKLGLLAAAILLVVQTFRLDAQATNRLFPPRPLSVRTPIGTGYWILFLFSMTHTAIGMMLPLALQWLHGVSPLAAGYGNASLAVSWTLASFMTAGWRGARQSAAIIGGPVVAVASLAILALGVATLSPLTSCLLTAVIGFGIGACNLHLVSLVMHIAEPGHETLTASSIPTIRSLGISFGAAGAGLIANMAGLGGGITVASVAQASSWVYGATILAPLASLLLALRMTRFRTATTGLVASAPVAPDQ